MANVRQDGVPDPTLERASPAAPEGAAINGRVAASRGIVLALRLRTVDSRGAGADVSWAGDSPAAALALDVISASGGAADPPRGAVGAARFFDLPSALLAARRLQWALEGMGESAESSTAASMAVYSAEDPAGAGVGSLLDTAAPGQVLVSSRIGEAIQQLPGATLGATSDGNWRVLEWRRVEAPAGLGGDEQSVLGLIRALGREDPWMARAEEAKSIAVGAVEPPASAESGGLGRARVEPEPESAFAKRKWWVMGGAAAAAVVIIAVVVMVSGGRGKPPAQSPAAPGTTAGPSAPAPQPVAPVVTSPAGKPLAAKQTAKPGKQPKAEAKTDAAPPRPVVTGSCDLTEADIPRSLSRAENYMYAGKLEEAQAIYQRLSPCPSAREKALEGLQRVRQRMAAQSP